MLLVLMMACTTTALPAQINNDLIGKWEANYVYKGEKSMVIYEFKIVDGKLQCYSILRKNDRDVEQKNNSLSMKKIRFEKGRGTCKYLLKYEEDTYNIKAKLSLKDKNTLEVSYSYYGYSDTEIWKRTQ